MDRWKAKERKGKERKGEGRGTRVGERGIYVELLRWRLCVH